jgi:hypothetical protein
MNALAVTKVATGVIASLVAIVLGFPTTATDPWGTFILAALA